MGAHRCTGESSNLVLFLGTSCKSSIKAPLLLLCRMIASSLVFKMADEEKKNGVEGLFCLVLRHLSYPINESMFHRLVMFFASLIEYD